MAVNEDLSAYSTTAASNTPAGGSNIGPDLDNHLRDIKRNVRRVAERYQGTTTPEAFRGREWIDTSATASTKLEVKLNDGLKEVVITEIDTSAGCLRANSRGYVEKHFPVGKEGVEELSRPL